MEAKQINKRLITLLVCAAVCALAIVLATALGCAPQEGAGDEAGKTEQSSGMEGQQVDWSMQTDCASCHTFEAETMEDAQCPQAFAHQAQDCISCHTGEPVLKTAHEGVTYGDKPASKATVQTVPEQACITCHGDMGEMAKVTAESTALTDSNGTSKNPHEKLTGEKHEANAPTCTDCHNNHSKDLDKDAMKYCAQCHHRGVFTCGNCHELRD